MKIETIKESDLADWRKLALEVEPLFGPMVGEPGFEEALMAVTAEKRAFTIRNDELSLCGVIVVSYEGNEIEWLAVASNTRQKGYGEKLLNHAIGKLDAGRPIVVETFDRTIPEGLGARKLYLKYGFEECESSGLNPAGLPTVLLRRAPRQVLYKDSVA
jgi:ribosomal protein S18 acetylase RimI-like enzyme